MLTNFLQILLFCFLSLMLVACGKQKHSVANIQWEKDTCDRCQMVIHNKKFAAQIHVFVADKKTDKNYRFDDLGCALIWLYQQAGMRYQNDPHTQIWVTDMQSGQWLNARKAWYVGNQRTPMGYGLGALENKPRKIEQVLNFQQALRHIQKVDQQYRSE